MKIVGCDLHARQQSIAMVDTETGEFTERPLPGNSEQYESFMLAWNRNPESGKWQEVLLPDEIQDAHSDAWKSLEAYIEKVDAEGRDELNPMDGIGPEKWEQIVTLPRSIRRF
jgi:hypothetical protein